MSNPQPAERLPESPPPRLRPGERPRWLGLEEPALVDSLRSRAQTARVGADALAAAVLEWGTVLDLLTARSVDGGAVLAAARSDLKASRLAPTPALRAWIAHLAGRGTRADDELPELCLPERVLVAAGPRLYTHLRAGSQDANALVIERAAARRGQTLEAFALGSALALPGRLGA